MPRGTVQANPVPCSELFWGQSKRLPGSPTWARFPCPPNSGYLLKLKTALPHELPSPEGNTGPRAIDWSFCPFAVLLIASLAMLGVPGWIDAHGLTSPAAIDSNNRVIRQGSGYDVSTLPAVDPASVIDLDTYCRGDRLNISETPLAHGIRTREPQLVRLPPVLVDELFRREAPPPLIHGPPLAVGFGRTTDGKCFGVIGFDDNGNSLQGPNNTMLVLRSGYDVLPSDAFEGLRGRRYRGR